MDKPRIKRKGDELNEHDQLVFELTGTLFDNAMNFIKEYLNNKIDTEESLYDHGLIAHSVLYNACANLIPRILHNLLVAIPESEQKDFIEQFKKNLCATIDLREQLRDESNCSH